MKAEVEEKIVKTSINSEKRSLKKREKRISREKE